MAAVKNTTFVSPNSLSVLLGWLTFPRSKTYVLNTGAKIPAIGLGTWQSKPNEVKTAVEVALKSGYRHIDTAAAYGNEKEVGDGIKASGVPRSDFFLTTKLKYILATIS